MVFSGFPASFKLTLIGLLFLYFAPAVFALDYEPRHPLETALTHCDEPGLCKLDAPNRVITTDGRIESVSQLREGPFKGSPESAAREFLFAHTDWIGIAPDQKNLRVARVAESPAGFHITFERIIDGLPVYPGNIVVSLDRENLVNFYFSSLYTFPDKIATASLSADFAKRTATAYLGATAKPNHEDEPVLVIWAGDNRDFAPCWRYRVDYENPRGDWEILVDANTGEIRRVKNRAAGINGTGMVFDPDPLTTSGSNYGSTGYVDNNDLNSSQLAAQRQSRTLNDIGHYVLLGVDYYNLSGPYCDIQDIELPVVVPTLQVENTVFNYTRDHDSFEDVNCYYHIDKSQRWIQFLGFTNIQNNPIQVDPHGESLDCAAHYHPSGNYITFGDVTNDVDAAEDGERILHEYGHAIQFATVPSWGGGDEERMGEGWGDYWSASYGKTVSNWQATWTASWGLHNCNGPRSLQANLHYPENNTGTYTGGQIWSQALYDAETNMGSRVVMNKLALQHHSYLGSGASMLTAAQALITADVNTYQGQHLFAISDAFVPRGLLDRPTHDTCPGNTITSLPYSHFSTTATANYDYSNCLATTAPDVVYTLSGSAINQAATITVSLCNSWYDTGVEVRTGGACPGTNVVACNDDVCLLQSYLTFPANQGQTYYIIVHGFLTYAGQYRLDVTSTGTPVPPANDLCSGSIAVSSLPYSHSGSTTNATRNFTTCGSTTAPEVFYTLNLPSAQTVTVSLCGSGYDTALEVRTAGACPGSTQTACNNNACGSQSELSFSALANQNYYVIVSGSGVNTGAYVLNISGVASTPPLPPDSLVVQRSGNNIVLNWTPAAGSGISYNIYRASTPDVPTTPGNLIATTASPFYSDLGRALNADSLSCYIVTANGTAALEAPDPDRGEVVSLSNPEQISEVCIGEPAPLSANQQVKH